MRKQILIRTLLGSGNLDFSIECLSSFLTNSYDDLRLEIFEDGSLKTEEILRLESSLKKTTVITRKSREERVLQALSGYPKCLEFRASNVMTFKLFDTMLQDKEKFIYLDTDVFFLQKFILPDLASFPIFMQDNQVAFSFNPIDFLKVKINVMAKFNAGFYYFPLEQFDLHFIESTLNAVYPKQMLSHVWAEQTMWAFLAARTTSKTHYLHPKQVVISSHDLVPNKDLIAVHLVSAARHQFVNVKSYAKDLEGNETFTPILLTEGTYLSKTGFIQNRLVTKFKSGLRRLKQ
ncbi:MAG: hypothetical protein WKF66_19255 [Pedobacter sp.]